MEKKLLTFPLTKADQAAPCPHSPAGEKAEKGGGGLIGQLMRQESKKEVEEVLKEEEESVPTVTEEEDDVQVEKVGISNR